MGNLAEGLSHTPMSSLTRHILAPTPDACFVHNDDVAREYPHHRAVSSLSRQATPVEVGVSVEDHKKLIPEVTLLRETLGHAQRTLDAVLTLLQALEHVETCAFTT